MAKKRVKGKSRRKTSASSGNIVASQRKVNIALVNLFVFAILSAISYSLYRWGFSNQTLVDFFWISSLITAFLAIAFLIAYLVLKFMRNIKG